MLRANNSANIQRTYDHSSFDCLLHKNHPEAETATLSCSPGAVAGVAIGSAYGQNCFCGYLAAMLRPHRSMPCFASPETKRNARNGKKQYVHDVTSRISGLGIIVGAITPIGPESCMRHRHYLAKPSYALPPRRSVHQRSLARRIDPEVLFQSFSPRYARLRNPKKQIGILGTPAITINTPRHAGHEVNIPPAQMLGRCTSK